MTDNSDAIDARIAELQPQVHRGAQTDIGYVRLGEHRFDVSEQLVTIAPNVAVYVANAAIGATQYSRLRIGGAAYEHVGRDHDAVSVEEFYYRGELVYSHTASIQGDQDPVERPEPGAAYGANSLLEALGLPHGPAAFSAVCARLLGLNGGLSHAFTGQPADVGARAFEAPDPPRNIQAAEAAATHDPTTDAPGYDQARRYFEAKYSSGSDNDEERIGAALRNWAASGEPPPEGGPPAPDHTPPPLWFKLFWYLGCIPLMLIAAGFLGLLILRSFGIRLFTE